MHLNLRNREINEIIEINQDYTPKINIENINNIFNTNDNLELYKIDQSIDTYTEPNFTNIKENQEFLNF